MVRVQRDVAQWLEFREMWHNGSVQFKMPSTLMALSTINPQSAGIDFRRQNQTSVSV